MQPKQKLTAILFLFALPLCGCQSAALGVLQGINNSLESRQAGHTYLTSNSSSSFIKLMLFGGDNNKQYLGCLNCDEIASDSIFNEYGRYGNKYSATSIWNRYGQYGSSYSQYSPWNAFASNPPVIVDEDGNFYGYFTVNEYYPKRTQISWIIRIIEISEKIMQ